LKELGVFGKGAAEIGVGADFGHEGMADIREKIRF